MVELTPDEQECRIRETMEKTGVTRLEVEFILVQETGGIDGDAIVEQAGDKPPGTHTRSD
jgi:hypothetical protein